MNTFKNDATKPQVKQTVDVIKKYIDAAHHNAYAGELEEHPYSFFGGWHFSAKIMEYETLCFYLLKALARPEIGGAVKAELGAYYEPLLEMVDRLNNFCIDMAQDQCQAPIDVFAIENYDQPQERLEFLHDRYAKLLAGIQHGEKLKQLIKNS